MTVTHLFSSASLALFGSTLAATLALATPARAQDTTSGTGGSTGSSTSVTPSTGVGKTDASGVEPPKEQWDNTNVEEVAGKTYLFVGVRYRGAIVPKFMENMFVDEGKTVYSNTVGLELDMRKDGFSFIPAISYQELGTGDILFKQKNTTDIVGNYNLVNSSLKIVYATADLLWSSKISKTLDFEYGAGFGIGAVFGDLVTNWVREDPNGSLHSDTGKRFVACQTVDQPGTGCNKADHQNSDKNKVGNYVEPSWFGGGSVPAVFPWLAVPQIGLRFKPIKQFVGRLGIGFSLTGFWFGLSAEYGLEHKPKEQQ